jgi:hypothetical protein
MAKHVKTKDSLDVQVRTRFMDEYGNEMQGVIEYDPKTGFGNRIKDAQRGLVENFYRGGGHIEIDGHTFTAENQDENEIAAITTLIDAKVARGTPEYEQLLKHHIDTNRQNEKDKQKDKDKDKNKLAGTTQSTAPTLDEVDVSIPFVARTQIARGEEVILDLHKREVAGIKSDNIHRPKGKVSPDKKSFE